MAQKETEYEDFEVKEKIKSITELEMFTTSLLRTVRVLMRHRDKTYLSYKSKNMIAKKHQIKILILMNSEAGKDHGHWSEWPS